MFKAINNKMVDYIDNNCIIWISNLIIIIDYYMLLILASVNFLVNECTHIISFNLQNQSGTIVIFLKSIKQTSLKSHSEYMAEKGMRHMPKFLYFSKYCFLGCSTFLN